MDTTLCTLTPGPGDQTIIPLQDLIRAAVKAGWDEPEVLTAIIEVADNLMLAHGSNAELDALLKALKRKPE